MQRKPFNLILLGDPASGKATQARRLAKKYHLYNFDMGREVRQPAARKQYDYAHTTGRGNLTPTNVVRAILRRVIQSVPARRGILFNGHPKMIGEAMFVAGLLKRAGRRDPLVIYLGIPTAETFRRTKKRRVYFGGKRVKRDDDAERSLKNRKRYYASQVSRTVAFFKKHYRFKKVSGVGNYSLVEERLGKIIDGYLS